MGIIWGFEEEVRKGKNCEHIVTKVTKKWFDTQPATRVLTPTIPTISDIHTNWIIMQNLLVIVLLVSTTADGLRCQFSCVPGASCLARCRYESSVCYNVFPSISTLLICHGCTQRCNRCCHRTTVKGDASWLEGVKNTQFLWSQCLV